MQLYQNNDLEGKRTEILRNDTILNVLADFGGQNVPFCNVRFIRKPLEIFILELENLLN